MNSIKKIAISGFLGLVVLSTAVPANVLKGQKIFIKKLKPACGFDGGQFAMKHTQDEWTAINTAGKFTEELSKICPKSQLNPKYVPDVYDFSYHYAKDSGNVPSC